MNKTMNMFALSLLILTLITAVILGFMAGPKSPLTWALVGVLVLIPVIHRKLMDRGNITWKEQYSVGIESIDQQHKKLINLINMLQTTVDYSTGEAFEREALDAVVDYTKTHFAYEEGLMSKYAYPGFEAHKVKHQEMIDEVEKLLSEYEQDPERAMRHGLTYLKQWLVRHINGTDKEYSDFLISKGAQ
jgi:hemerythrin-like metal-binding protein